MLGITIAFLVGVVFGAVAYYYLTAHISLRD